MGASGASRSPAWPLPVLSVRHHSSSLRKISAGGLSSWANARSAARSWPMTAAARAPRPSTSPMTMPTRPADSGMMSYQSPPTWVWMPWPWVTSGLAGTYPQATPLQPVELGQLLGQQAGLEGQRGPPLLLEQHRVVDGHRDPAGHRAEELAVVRVVVLLVPLGQPGQGQAHHAEEFAPGDQRGGHDRPQANVLGGSQAGRAGRGWLYLVEVLDQDRLQAGHGLLAEMTLGVLDRVADAGPAAGRRDPGARVRLRLADQLVALKQV